MDSPIYQGLILSVTGLILTFASLGLLVIILILLQRFFSRPQAPVAVEEEEMEEEIPAAIAPAQPTEEVAAAIAAALTYLSPEHAARENQLGQTLKTGPGHWWRRSQLHTRR